MSSIQRSIASLKEMSADLLAKLSELDKLRDEVRTAQLAAQKSVQVNPRSKPHPSGVVVQFELRRGQSRLGY